MPRRPMPSALGSFTNIVECTDVVRPPKRTLAEQAGKGCVRDFLADRRSIACKARCSRGGRITTFMKLLQFM